MAFLLFLIFVGLLLMGFPVAFSLGVSSLVYLLLKGVPLNIIPQKMYSGIDSFVLLCIPAFIVAGNLMNTAGITRRIIHFSNAIVGFIRGGLALANVAASMIFAGISGTALADTASIGAILIPAMKDEGYDADFSAAVTASSSTVGPIIPPSVPMIIVGTLTGLSVTRLFLAGAIPGILLGFSLMAITYYLSVKRNYPKGERLPFRCVIRTLIDASWALGMVVLILFGILGGVFTPTEASVVAVVYALLVGLLVYRELKPRDIPRIVIESVRMTTAVMILVGLARLFAWIVTTERIPQLVAQGILSLSTNPYIVIFLINAILLFVGCFMETVAALVIFVPVLLPVAMRVGMDPIHFAVMVVLNLIIGLTTPPVGVCLFVAANIAKISLGELVKAMVPFLLVLLAVLFLVSYVPVLSLTLPNLLR
ncbi:MAG: TRAP transporter large permease [Candidatus Caldatribacterium sp.]|uniref:TRAP transporter large permease n=1 Tax=Candidatus Caldatribacterium sp. TaxID=2282143 RepID=UPI0029971214|nr:TRAP transporter large permease [Candidatus Caldatribacterium sp.]MCX7730616.1 TRAP transporter large permease [Candidatus Caldatribacterium sp.]MDW8081586.1 TRAP transporter large permease [Candidatus Calescibacterium sp.]